MKRFIFMIGLCLAGSVASAQIQPMDTEGTAYLLRDRLNATVVITGSASKKISEYMTSSPSSIVTCGAGYCSIGQWSRAGQVSKFTGEFAKTSYFPNFVSHESKPTSLSEAGWYQQYASQAWVYPNQCQDQKLQTIDLLNVEFKGIAAEQLYNFLSKSEKPNDRVGAFEKLAAKDLFECEKMSKCDDADVDTANGNSCDRHSFYEYECRFNVRKDGQLAPRTSCSIYGASSSAGGGR